MKTFSHLILTCALLISCGNIYAQSEQKTTIVNENGYKLIKIADKYHCPYDISDNKKHVVFQAWGEGLSYYWSEETGVIEFSGNGYAVSDEGVVAGWFVNEEFYYVAGLWHPNTQKWEFLGMNPDVPQYADFDYNSAWTMSNDGKILGIMQYDANWNTYTYTWSEREGYVKLSNGQSTVTRPQAMNNDGSVLAGFYVDDIGYRAPCYWLGGELFPISSYLGESWGVSPNGRFVCGNLKNSQGNAFIYDITNDELILIKNTLEDYKGTMTAMCVTDNGDAFGYICIGDPVDYTQRRGFAYVDGKLMKFEDYLMINGVDEADSWTTYCVNSVTPDGKTFLGAAQTKAEECTFVITIGEAPCKAPENLIYTIDENNYNTVTLRWDAPEDADNVTYEIYTSYTEIDPIYQGITDTFFTIENMDAGLYKFVVKANWNGECLSNPSNAVELTIYPCNPDDMCELTFKMLDGYGDGWNEAYIDIRSESNDFSYTIGLKKEGLDTVTQTISICPDYYYFTWSRGEFDEEISFSILFDGTEIYKADTGKIDFMFNTNFLQYDIDCNENENDEVITNITNIEHHKLEIHPNPVNDKLYIEAETEIEEVVVYDVYGRIQNLRNSEDQNLRTSVDVTNLNSGVYFVKIKTEDGNITKRFVKQ